MKRSIIAFAACAALLAGCQTTPAGDPLAAKVQSALKKDEHVGKFKLQAANDNGKVMLTGKVNNEFQQYHAGEVTKKVEGVKSVDNKIQVN